MVVVSFNAAQNSAVDVVQIKYLGKYMKSGVILVV